MSRAHRTARAYALLKRQIMTGERHAAERLDPARLARELEVSATPVRDALHQLHGERLVEAWPRGGFKVPMLSESELSDLYGWNGEIAAGLLRYVRSSLVPPPTLAPHDPDDLAETARAYFAGLATWLGHGEHQAAIAQASDRLHRARLAEGDIFPDAHQELAALIECQARASLSELREFLVTYHQRRQRHARHIRAAIREGKASSRT